VFLDDPTLKPKTRSELRLKHRAIIEFKLTHNKLYRWPDNRFLLPRYVALESEAIDIVANKHLQLLHVGREKVCSIAQQEYYGINRQEVAFVRKL
jgi:hypothetical protein